MNLRYLIIFGLTIVPSFSVVSEELDFKISLGTSITDFNSSIQVNSQTFERNGKIDFEDDLGYDHSVNYYLARIDADLTDNHKFSVTFSPFNRRARVENLEDLQFEGNTLLAGAMISSETNNSVYDLEYAYKFRTNQRSQFELIAGIYWMKTDFNLAASGVVENEVGEIEFDANFKQDSSTNIPLPLLGIRNNYEVNNNITIISAIKYFESSLNGIKGGISSYLLSTEYALQKNMGIGASLHYFKVDIDVHRENFEGALMWQHSGIDIHFYYRF